MLTGPAGAPGEPDVAAEVRAWFGGYLAAFRALASGAAADPRALLAFYAAPLAVASGDRVLALPVEAAVAGFAGEAAAGLRRAGYAGGEALRLDVRPLNARAAWVEGAFVRRGAAGAELGRLGAAYLATRTDAGWRIAALVLLDG